jgi:hypothetical protein
MKENLSQERFLIKMVNLYIKFMTKLLRLCLQFL